MIDELVVEKSVNKLRVLRQLFNIADGERPGDVYAKCDIIETTIADIIEALENELSQMEGGAAC